MGDVAEEMLSQSFDGQLRSEMMEYGDAGAVCLIEHHSSFVFLCFASDCDLVIVLLPPMKPYLVVCSSLEDFQETPSTLQIRYLFFPSSLL